MFYILSKILLFLISPICWVLMFLSLALILKSNNSLQAALILLFLFSCNPINTWVVGQYEYQTILTEDIEDTYDIGILLTGSEKRLFDPIELYREGKIKKILIVGTKEETEEYVERLIRLGIPKNDLLTNDKSLNTYLSALNCKPLLETIQKKQLKPLKILLITSALHMRRSRLCFLKQGINFTSLSVDYIVDPDYEYKGDYPLTFKILNLIPSVHSISNWTIMIKEWVGIVVYKISGYI